MVKMYSIYDTKAEGWLPSFEAPNALVAMRRVQDETRSADHPMNMHGGDYYVFEVGERDPATGMITGYEKTAFVGLGSVEGLHDDA